MIVLQILIAVVAAIGLGFILSDVFSIPKYPVSKAITTLGKRQKKKTNPLDIWLGDLANRIADKLKLNEYKRLQLKADLDSADMTVSPEQRHRESTLHWHLCDSFSVFRSDPLTADRSDRGRDLLHRIQEGGKDHPRKTPKDRIRTASLGLKHRQDTDAQP